ncbi:hypothetical protein BGX21_003169 [Mortierella sp. AD011]|nr:hypothetical protein BGX20_003336 [Mortierella sp. AD010]KAF9377517.1 hypothetical protein BGX21_003169 [Mortierella sp. AD011]
MENSLLPENPTTILEDTEYIASSSSIGHPHLSTIGHPHLSTIGTTAAAAPDAATNPTDVNTLTSAAIEKHPVNFSKNSTVENMTDLSNSSEQRTFKTNAEKVDNGTDEGTEPAAAVLTTFPDGGFGWLVVLGAFVIQFCCWGFNFSWGVYQEYYVENDIFKGATLSQISWCGGLGAASVFLTCPFQTQMVSKFGLRPVIATGIVISGSGMISASFAKTVWQLYLTQASRGFMFGLGAGMALFNSVAIPVQWFDKKRGLATGITVAGSGIGGATLAPLNRFLISNVGYKWALRIMGITVITAVFSILFCIRARIRPAARRRPLFDVGMFKSTGFTVLYLTGMLMTFGYLTPIFLLPKFITDLGWDPTVGATLVSVFSGVNAAARIGLGFVADICGPLNVLILSTIFCGLSCYMFWMNTHDLAMATVFAIAYGTSAGGFVSLFPVVAAKVIGLETLAATVGLLFSGNFFGNLLGTPLASAIISASGGSYTWAIVFAGAAPLVGASLLLIIRFKDERRIFVKV